jgi:hypothetical protein
MKVLVFCLFAFSCPILSAQSLNLDSFMRVLTQKKASLEFLRPGMTKKLITISSFESEDGEVCNYEQSSLQSVLKIEGEKMIVLSDETFTPGPEAGCEGSEAFREKVLFFEDVPTLSQLEADLRQTQVLTINLNGNLAQLNVKAAGVDEDGNPMMENLKLLYNLNMPLFKMVSKIESELYTTTMTDMPDANLITVDLTNVLFCPAADSQDEDCAEGDFSDILF